MIYLLSLVRFGIDALKSSGEHEPVLNVEPEAVSAIEYHYTDVIGCHKNYEEPVIAMHLCLVL